MEILKDCGVCYLSFDTQKRAPRVLPCGHTLCFQCLTKIFSSSYLRRCPFDNSPFTPFQNSLDCFPPNFIVLEFLERKNDGTCKIHPDEKLKLICLTDKRKLCYECVESGEHNGHTIKKIRELKAQGAKVKGELESTLLQVKEYELNENKNCEKIKKNLISTIDEKCKEIKDLIVEKQFELVSFVNNIFDVDKQKCSENISAFKQQLDETVKDITHACKNDSEDLILLEKALNSDHNALKTLPQILEEKSSGVHNKFLKMQKSLEQSLNYSKEVISALQISGEEVVKEIYSMNEEAEFSKIYQKLQTLKFSSYFDVKKTLEGLEISVCPGQPKAVEVKNGDFKAVEAIDIKLGRYDLLMKEPNLLTYIFCSGLEKLTSLEISFDSREFNGYLVVWFAKIISDSVQSLKSLCVDLEKCHVCGETLISFCDLVFPKMRDLKDFYLYLNSSEIHSEVLEIWINALTPFQKNLEYFALGLAHNDLTDGEFYQVSQMIQSMDGLKSLELILSVTKITDKSLEELGENLLPRLKALESFMLYLDKCHISDKGVLSILRNLRNLRNLELNLSSTQITNMTLNVFSRVVSQRLNNSLKYFTFIAKNTKVSKKNWEVHDVFERIITLEKEEEDQGCGDSSDGFFLRMLLS